MDATTSYPWRHASAQWLPQPPSGTVPWPAEGSTVEEPKPSKESFWKTLAIKLAGLLVTSQRDEAHELAKRHWPRRTEFL